MALFMYFSRVWKLLPAEDTNKGVEANEECECWKVQHVMEDTENEASQRWGRKRKVFTAFTPEQWASIGTVIVKYRHV